MVCQLLPSSTLPLEHRRLDTVTNMVPLALALMLHPSGLALSRGPRQGWYPKLMSLVIVSVMTRYFCYNSRARNYCSACLHVPEFPPAPYLRSRQRRTRCPRFYTIQGIVYTGQPRSIVLHGGISRPPLGLRGQIHRDRISGHDGSICRCSCARESRG